jgi:predicted amidohydrolase YtcJ
VTSLVLTDVEVEGRRVDVRCTGGRIGEVAPHLPLTRTDEVVKGGGGALLPGLHDHHIHLLAAAAAARSVRVGPPDVHSPEGLAEVLRQAACDESPSPWIRAVGYHESVAGSLTRHLLDTMVPERPLRVQHRSGALWVLNTAGCHAIGALAASTGPMEVDGRGSPTGRIFGGDDWLRGRLPPENPPDLHALGLRLAQFGVTGVTDATPTEEPAAFALLASAGLPQRVQVTGGPSLTRVTIDPALQVGPVKLMIADHDLPPLELIVRWYRAAHDAGRPVAVHCVTRVALVLALAAWQEAGAVRGDRIEHASVVPLELMSTILELELKVVTQPNFIGERGDEYRRDVPFEDWPDLYRCHSLMAAGIPVAAGTDAPFGHPDPWRAIDAAVTRRSPSGWVFGGVERIGSRQALGLFLSALEDPGGAERRLRPGGTADLVLLGAPLQEVLNAPSSACVKMTVIGGRVVAHGR